MLFPPLGSQFASMTSGEDLLTLLEMKKESYTFSILKFVIATKAKGKLVDLNLKKYKNLMAEIGDSVTLHYNPQSNI